MRWSSSIALFVASRTCLASSLPQYARRRYQAGGCPRSASGLVPSRSDEPSPRRGRAALATALPTRWCGHRNRLPHGATARSGSRDACRRADGVPAGTGRPRPAPTAVTTLVNSHLLPPPRAHRAPGRRREPPASPRRPPSDGPGVGRTGRAFCGDHAESAAAHLSRSRVGGRNARRAGCVARRDAAGGATRLAERRATPLRLPRASSSRRRRPTKTVSRANTTLTEV